MQAAALTLLAFSRRPRGVQAPQWESLNKIDAVFRSLGVAC